MIAVCGPPECAPDLSDPMSVATYAVEEIAEAKDAFVRHFSDEEGTNADPTWRKQLKTEEFSLQFSINLT